MSKFLSKVERLAKSRTMIISFSLFLLLLLMVNVVFKSEQSYLTQTINYTPEKAYTMLNDYGAGGRQAHARVLVADIVMVILYTMFLSGAIYRTFKKVIKNKTVLSILCAVPFALGIIQLMEVAGIFTLLVKYPVKMIPLARVTNTLTIIKVNLTVVCFILPVIGFITSKVKQTLLKSAIEN